MGIFYESETVELVSIKEVVRSWLSLVLSLSAFSPLNYEFVLSS